MFLTVDLPYRGQRHADIKNGLTVPPRLTMRNAWDMTTKVRWWSSLIGKRKSFGNLESYLGKSVGTLRQGSWATQNSDQSLNWRDLDWIRERWNGKLVLKGILDVEDAKRAASEGVDGIVVSNHGGRQLDGASGTMAVLPSHRRCGRRPARSAARWRRALRPRRLQGDRATARRAC